MSSGPSVRPPGSLSRGSTRGPPTTERRALKRGRFVMDFVGTLPFPLLSVRVDGGSESMAGFQTTCEQLGVNPARATAAPAPMKQRRRAHEPLRPGTSSPSCVLTPRGLSGMF